MNSLIPEGLATFTVSEIEEQARTLLRRSPAIKPSPPINIEFMLEVTENVVLKLKNGMRHRYSIEGCVCKEVGSHDLTVLIDTSVFCGHLPHYREVLAEELAHIHLHRGLLLCVKDEHDFLELQSHPDWAKHERDARQFSRAILMPSKVVIEQAEVAYAHIVNESGFIDAISVERLLQNALAEIFGVKPETMQKRLIGWPCHIRSRVLSSVQTRSSFLLPEDWELSASQPAYQRQLFG